MSKIIKTKYNWVPLPQPSNRLGVSAELPLAEELGGLGADNFNNGRQNLMDITHLVTPENYNDISFWRGNPEITICMSHPSNSKDPPFGYGLILTTVVNEEVSQVFFRQSSGEVLRRSGSGYGWNADPTLNGKDAWQKVYTENDFIIQRGQSAEATVPANSFVDIEITYPKPFNTQPTVIAVPYISNSNRAFTVGLNTTTNLTQKASFKVKSHNSIETNTYLMWLAIGT